MIEDAVLREISVNWFHATNEQVREMALELLQARDDIIDLCGPAHYCDFTIEVERLRSAIAAVLKVRCDCNSKIRGFECCWMPSDAQIILTEALQVPESKKPAPCACPACCGKEYAP